MLKYLDYKQLSYPILKNNYSFFDNHLYDLESQVIMYFSYFIYKDNLVISYNINLFK